MDKDPSILSKFMSKFISVRYFKGFLGTVALSFVDVTTNYTSSTKISIRQRLTGFWENVPMYTTNLSRIYTRHTIGTQYIKTLLNKLHMVWIAARGVVADDMVENMNSVIVWQWLNKYCIEQSVNFLICATEIYNTISLILGTHPNPTTVFFVDSDFRKDTLFLGGSEYYRKHKNIICE